MEPPENAPASRGTGSTSSPRTVVHRTASMTRPTPCVARLPSFHPRISREQVFNAGKGRVRARNMLGFVHGDHTQRRDPPAPAGNRRDGGPARAPGRPVLGAQGPRRVVDPEGRGRRGRGPARVRAARVRRGDRHAAPRRRARRARLREAQERQASCWPSRSPATSTRTPSAATRSSSSGRRAPAACSPSRRSTAPSGSRWTPRARSSTPRRPSSSTGWRRCSPALEMPGVGVEPTRPLGQSDLNRPRLPVTPPGRDRAIVRAAGGLAARRRARWLPWWSNFSALSGFSRAESVRISPWKSRHSPTPASPAHTRARRCCGCSPTSA